MFFDKKIKNKSLEEARKEYADFMHDMESSGRMEDNAFAMYMLLKDIAGGSFDYDLVQAFAQDLVDKVEGRMQ